MLCEVVYSNCLDGLKICEKIIGTSWIFMYRVRGAVDIGDVMSAGLDYREELMNIGELVVPIIVADRELEKYWKELENLAEKASRGELAKNEIIEKVEASIKKICGEVMKYFVKEPCEKALS